MSEAVVEYQQGIVRGFSPPLTPTMTLEVFSFPPVGPWASGLGYAPSLMVQVHVDADGVRRSFNCWQRGQRGPAPLGLESRPGALLSRDQRNPITSDSDSFGTCHLRELEAMHSIVIVHYDQVKITQGNHACGMKMLPRRPHDPSAAARAIAAAYAIGPSAWGSSSMPSHSRCSFSISSSSEASI